MSVADESRPVSAITDICLVNMDAKDPIPSNFELVERTVGGVSANLFSATGTNYALCIRRATHQNDVPICDIQSMFGCQFFLLDFTFCVC
jgi:hypothetical protein